MAEIPSAIGMIATAELLRSQRRAMGCAHGALSLGSVLFITVSLGVAYQFAIDADDRTLYRAAFCIGALLIGTLLAVVQYKIYRRWGDEFE